MAFDFSDFHLKADKVIQHIKQDISSLRTGRASAQLLDSVIVMAYASQLKLTEVAQISTPDPNMLIVKPWDRSILTDVEKAIASAGLNLSPVVDGEIVRIVVPPLTEERRKEMVKQLHQKIESGRVMLRSVRTDAKQEIEDQKGEADVSDDDIHRDLEQLDKLYQEHGESLEDISRKKEQELLTV